MRTIDIKTFKHQCGYETETECLQFLLTEAKPEIETLTKALQKTYENHDKQHHAKVVHQLKGATAFGYAPALYESCTALQKALKEDETTATCDTLYQTVSQTLQAVQQDFEMLPAAIALENFLSEWDKQYQSKASVLPLFNSDLSNQWSKAQQIKFVYLFYHARGHFNEFLWLLGNNAPNKPYKGIVLENFNEEFGGDGRSHEALYFEFGKALGVDLMEERLNEQHYLPFLREFNHAHLDWLTRHAWHHQWAAFSAYERLDNVDGIVKSEVRQSHSIFLRMFFENIQPVTRHYGAPWGAY